MATLKIAGVQLDMAWQDKEGNLRKAESLISEAVRHGADVVVLPEMFATGFSTDVSQAEPVFGPTETFLCEQAAKHAVNIVGGYMAKGEGKPCNVAVAVDRAGEVLARYAKMHLFTLAKEPEVMDAGDGTVVFEFDGVRFSLFICFDLRFPEVYRVVARDVDAIITIASWPFVRQRHWDMLLEARAVENQCYVVGVNRVGTGDGIEYGGGSCIVAPGGQVVVREFADEKVMYGAIDTDVVDRMRLEFPFLDAMKHC